MPTMSQSSARQPSASHAWDLHRGYLVKQSLEEVARIEKYWREVEEEGEASCWSNEWLSAGQGGSFGQAGMVEQLIDGLVASC
jgi:hypothetical protein